MSTVEERLAKVERDLEAIKNKMPAEPKSNWLNKVHGTFKDAPDYDEIVRLGKEFRDSDRPKE